MTLLTSKTSKRKSVSSRHRAIVESLEHRVLLTAATGTVDIANRTQIVGWAYDSDTPFTSITVQFNVDGTTSNLTASQTRNDLVPVIGSANHGFTFTVPALSPGNHVIVLSAADSTTGTLTKFKTINLVNPAGTGWVDVASSTTVSGWAFDPDSAASPISVRIDNNGATVSTISASSSRPDLTASIGSPNHGFSLSGSFGVVDVYALDNPTGTPTLIGSTSVKAKGGVDILATTRIAGWAYTPDMGALLTGIEVDVDGVNFQTNLANQSRPDLVGITGSANNGFDFALNPLTPGTHKVEVFAIDSKTTFNNKVLLGAGTLTNKAPTGTIDVVNSIGVAGWVFDSTAGSTPISVQISVDDAVVGTIAASQSRPDLTPVVGSPLHGFTFNYPTSLSAGPHKIQISAIDVPTGTAVLVATKFLNNTLPFGFLDSANLANVQGWAYDPNTPNTPVNVIAVLDGVRDVPQPASNFRAGLVPTLPDGNHAFFLQTPTNLTGKHTLSVIAVDTFSGQEVVLGTKQFVNLAPRGHVDLYSATQVAGWTQDPDQPTTAITVLVRIDGVISQIDPSVPGNVVNRPDLTPIIGSANHGFSLSFSALASGKHFIEVFGEDPITHVTTLIGSQLIIAP